MKDTMWEEEVTADAARGDKVYKRAVRSIRQAETRRAAAGHAWMAAALGYGEASMGTGRFGKISHYAKLFCIGFACLVPSLLVIHVAF